MQSLDHANEHFIKITPLYLTAPVLTDAVEIYKLTFWYDNRFDHPINPDTLRRFLFYAELYGAYFYPESPDMGCFAINGGCLYQQGEVRVNHIQYKGELIYCFSKSVH
jgi:hypothetical protein